MVNEWLGAPRRQCQGLVLLTGTAVVIAVLWRVAAVPPYASGQYIVYVGTVQVLPGCALWRLARLPGWNGLGSCLTFGWVAGCVVEIPVYLALSRFGVPHLIWLLPLVALFSLRTRRSSWLPPCRGRSQYALVVLALFVALVALLARLRWTHYPADQVGFMRDRDEGFQLALTGELMHHVDDLTFPYLAGTPLQYHWGSFVHMASAARSTGLEAAVIVRVLAPTAFAVMLFFVLQRLAAHLWRDRWAGVLAAGLWVCASYPDYFGWTTSRAPVLGNLLDPGELFVSPSQAQGCSLALVAFLLVLEISKAHARWPAPWALCGFLTALALVKAPLLLAVAGASAAVAVWICLRYRAWRPGLVLLAAPAAVLFGSTRLLYGGSTRSSVLAPGDSAWLTFPTLVQPEPGHAQMWIIVLAAAALPLTLALPSVLAGASKDHPQAILAAVLLLASVALWLLIGHVYASQFYILHLGGLVGVILLAGACLRLASSWPARLAGVPALVVMALGGWILVNLIGRATARVTPPLPTRSASATAVAALLPFLPLLLAAFAIWASRARGARKEGPGRLGAASLAASLVLGSTLQMLLPTGGVFIAPPPPQPISDTAGPGAVEAARWIRSHSSADQLVATNAHCYLPSEAPCQSQHFWIAGLTERRVLVEGWGYIPRPEVSGKKLDTDTLPFWDRGLLISNDAAFTDASSRSIQFLRGRGVHWLLVDTRYPSSPERLKEAARSWHEFGRYLAVEIG